MAGSFHENDYCQIKVTKQVYPSSVLKYNFEILLLYGLSLLHYISEGNFTLFTAIVHVHYLFHISLYDLKVP